MRALGPSALARRAGIEVFLLFVCVSFLYLGLAPLVDSGNRVIGTGADPMIFVWSFAWWPHAILHGQDPFVTHGVWAPEGVNLTWATTVPGLAILFSPVTLIAGPVVAFNVACVLLPAFAGWTAFLLCRYLTGSFWPSLVGGYLFGFCSEITWHMISGELNLTSLFLLPLIALYSLKFLDGALPSRGFVVRLGLLLLAQLSFSTEVSFTLALAQIVSIAIALWLVPERRARLRALSGHLVLAYVFAGFLASPFVYFLATGFRAGEYTGASHYFANVLSFVLPSNISLIGSSATSALDRSFPDPFLTGEGYIGIPALLIVALYARQRIRTQSSRFLVAALAAALIATLGAHAYISATRLFPLPYDLVQDLPFFNNVAAVRLAGFAGLATAVIVALWTKANSGRRIALALPMLAIASLVVYPNTGAWSRAYTEPAFFTDSSYRHCLAPGETVLQLPIVGEADNMLWQADTGFRFKMAGGYLGPVIPPSFLDSSAARDITNGNHLGPDQATALREFIASKHITTVIVAASEIDFFNGALNSLTTQQSSAGGVVLYHFGPHPKDC